MQIYEVRISHGARVDIRKWVYVYHIEESFVIVDRILPAKMNKG